MRSVTVSISTSFMRKTSGFLAPSSASLSNPPLAHETPEVARFALLYESAFACRNMGVSTRSGATAPQEEQAVHCPCHFT